MEASGTASRPGRRGGWPAEAGRWLLALGGVGAAFWLVVYLSLFGLFLGPFPKDLAEPTASFLMAFLVVTIGGLLAPRRRLLSALLLVVPGLGLATWLMPFPDAPALAGAIGGVAVVAWTVWPERPRSATTGGAIGATLAVVAFAGLVGARYLDWPARPDPLSPDAREAFGPGAPGVAAFYVYDLGGFIDREWLWRVDAAPDAVARLVDGLGLQRARTVPSSFWRMPPHYWPRALPKGAEAFTSRAFSAEARGPDGAHYFLVHDRAQGRAFVWLKLNF